MPNHTTSISPNILTERGHGPPAHARTSHASSGNRIVSTTTLTGAIPRMDWHPPHRAAVAIGAQGCKYPRLSRAKRARTPQARALRSLGFRGHLQPNEPDHLAKRTLKRRIMTMPQAKRAEASQVKLSQSPRFRGCLERNGPEHIATSMWDPRLGRAPQTKRHRSQAARASRSEAEVSPRRHNRQPPQYMRHALTRTPETASRRPEICKRPR